MRQNWLLIGQPFHITRELVRDDMDNPVSPEDPSAD